MRTFLITAGRTALVAALAGLSTLGVAADADDIAALREQIRQLDQKLRILERKQELKDEDAAAAAKAAPKIGITDKGFTLASGDGANSVSLRGLVQLDSRLFFNESGAATNSFVLRRARIISEGTFAKYYSFQLVPEFGGTGAVSILDANGTVAPSKAFQFKFGKFKVPVGLELLQSDSWTFFNERSLVSNLVPNRDLGVQIGGSLKDGVFNYALGAFGGVGDGGSSTNADVDNEKDVVGRVYVQPFKANQDSALQGLSVGVAGSVGREKTASGRTAGYRTDGQQTFFSYLATTVNDGQNWRVSPQAEYRHGPFGALGEYVVSTINVRPSATGAKAELQNKAWQLSAGYVLTGENSSYNGVVPRQNFDWSAGTWGAWEVAARYADLKVDDATFPTFASAATNANQASSVGLGLNWYLSKTVRFTFDYYHTKYHFAPAAPAVSTSQLLRHDEDVLISRFQVAF